MIALLLHDNPDSGGGQGVRERAVSEDVRGDAAV
jgi:hypothetical protein